MARALHCQIPGYRCCCCSLMTDRKCIEHSAIGSRDVVVVVDSKSARAVLPVHPGKQNLMLLLLLSSVMLILIEAVAAQTDPGMLLLLLSHGLSSWSSHRECLCWRALNPSQGGERLGDPSRRLERPSGATDWLPKPKKRRTGGLGRRARSTSTH